MILDRIVSKRRVDLINKKNAVPFRELEKLASKNDKSFLSALMKEGISLIAETKKASPSKGIIKEDYHPEIIAREYEAGGASAISVLTEPSEFLGNINDIGLVRKACSLPVLQKDFIFDPYQIYEGRVAGANAVLLIVAMLDKTQLDSLLIVCDELSMDALVEVHSMEELEIALSTSTRTIGINNRDLKTFNTSLEVTEKLAPYAKEAGKIVVSESGIHNASDVRMLEQIGVDAILVGEALMASDTPRDKIAELLRTKDVA